MVRFEGRVQQRKCLLASLEYPCKISETLDNRKTRFMLGHFSLAIMHLERNIGTYHTCISLAYSKGEIRRIVHMHGILVVIVKLCAIGRKVGGEAQRTN